jgi:hypothetical protein
MSKDLSAIIAQARYTQPTPSWDTPCSPQQAAAAVALWVKQALVQEDGCKVASRNLLRSFHGWQHSEFGPNVSPLDIRTFIPKLYLCCPFIVPVLVRGVRYAGGCRLTEQGLRYGARHPGLGSYTSIRFAAQYVNLEWRGPRQIRPFRARETIDCPAQPQGNSLPDDVEGWSDDQPVKAVEGDVPRRGP